MKHYQSHYLDLQGGLFSWSVQRHTQKRLVQSMPGSDDRCLSLFSPGLLACRGESSPTSMEYGLAQAIPMYDQVKLTMTIQDELHLKIRMTSLASEPYNDNP